MNNHGQLTAGLDVPRILLILNYRGRRFRHTVKPNADLTCKNRYQQSMLTRRSHLYFVITGGHKVQILNYFRIMLI